VTFPALRFDKKKNPCYRRNGTGESSNSEGLSGNLEPRLNVSRSIAVLAKCWFVICNSSIVSNSFTARGFRGRAIGDSHFCGEMSKGADAAALCGT
jgi:hypothetical protein